MFKKLLFSLALIVGFAINTQAQAANTSYWTEGFNASQGCDLGTLSPTSFVGSYFNTNNGSWYQAGCYRTTGTGCPAGNEHIRAKNIAGSTDSNYIITPIVPNGIQELHFSRARSNRRYSIAVTSDTSATTTNWTQVYFIPSSAATVTCADTMITINSQYAKRLRIKFEPGKDSDIDSLWLTRYSASFPLSVTLLSFTGKKEANSNVLNWATSQEQNNAYFNVQRSTNAKDFITIGKVNAKGELGINNYELRDEKSKTGHNYYRLQQVDNDGKSTLSEVIKLSNPQIGTLVNVYPNPTSSIINVELSTLNLQPSTIKLLDMSGRVIKEMTVTQSTTQIDMSQLSVGLYQLQVLQNNKVIATQKVQKK